MFLWWRFRRMLRFAVPHIEEQKAFRWDKRLRYTYIFLAWNAMAIAWYFSYKMKKDPNYKETDVTRSDRWAKLVKSDHPNYIRIQGLKIVEITTKDEIDRRNAELNENSEETTLLKMAEKEEIKL